MPHTSAFRSRLATTALVTAALCGAPPARVAAQQLVGPRVSVPVSSWLAMMTDDGRCIYGGNAMGVIGQGQCSTGYAVFKPVYHAANYYTITTSGGQCVTMPSAKGGAMSTQPCADAATQRYFFNSSGQIQRVGANLCIDIAGGQRNSSYRLIAWNCDLNGNIAARAWNQRFTFAFLVVVPPGVRLNQSFALGNRSLAQEATRGSVVAPSSAGGAPSLISQDGNGIVAQGGGNIVAQGGGNLIAIAATNVVAQGGGNIVAQGGGNILLPASGIVAQGGGNVIFVGHN